LAWRSLRDRPWFGAVPTLTAAAAVTDRIRLGPLVATPNFRHPVPFARELITLDDVSAGRLTLGLGAGGPGWDATMLGQAPWSARERAARFGEFVELTDRLLREPATSHRGRYFVADEARTYPGCVQQPRVPFAIAATGPRGMRLAASYGEVWVTTGDRHRERPLPADDGARVVRAQLDVDPLIARHLAKGWRLARIDSILRAILRGGTYELLERPDIPARVIINEYLEVAPAFFGGDEPGVVNGVLDSIAREIRSPEFSRPAHG